MTYQELQIAISKMQGTKGDPRVETGTAPIKGRPSHVKVSHYEDGGVRREEWVDDKGRPHRNCGPALVECLKDQTVVAQHFYSEGKLHREGGPARSIYFRNGKLRQASFYQDGLLHRSDGPAYEEYDKNGNSVKTERWIRGRVAAPHLESIRTVASKSHQTTVKLPTANQKWNLLRASFRSIGVGLRIDAGGLMALDYRGWCKTVLRIVDFETFNPFDPPQVNDLLGVVMLNVIKFVMSTDYEDYLTATPVEEVRAMSISLLMTDLDRVTSKLRVAGSADTLETLTDLGRILRDGIRVCRAQDDCSQKDAIYA